MTETLSIVTTDYMLRRIRSEYLEMPGLRLTRRQAQRLWGLDEHTCARLLDSLAEAKFLHRKDDGTYARLTDGAVAAPADSTRPPVTRSAGLSTPNSRLADEVRGVYAQSGQCEPAS